jgi:hypothetical protein
MGSARSLVGRTRFPRTRSPGGSLPRRRLSGVGPKPPRYPTSPRETLRSALRARGKDASHRPLQTNLHHEHSWTSLDFLRSRPSLRRSARPGENPARGRSLMQGPSRRRSEEALDGAPSALASQKLAALAEARVARRSVPCSARAELQAARRLGRRFRPFQRRAGLPLTRSVAPATSRPRERPSREPGPPLPLLSSKRAAHLDPARLSTAEEPPPRLLAQALQVPLAGFLQSIRFTSATAWTTPSPVSTREVALARRERGGNALASTAGRRFSVQGAGSGSRRIGLVQAMPGGATPKPIPAEHLTSRARPATGWRSRPRAASPPRERAHPQVPLARDPRCTLRAAFAGAPVRGFGPVRNT